MTVNPTTDPISKIEFGQMIQRLDDIASSVHRLEKMLIGNGDQGLMSRQAVLEDNVKDLQETLGKIKAFVYATASTLALGIGGFLWGIVTHKITLVF